MSPKVEVKDIAVNIRTSKDDSDYFSLTDMAKWKNSEEPDQVIANWMRTNFSIRFLGLWEITHNKNFNPIEFEGFKNQSGENGFVLSPKKWVSATNAIGIYSKSGRYGGTFAHRTLRASL